MSENISICLKWSGSGDLIWCDGWGAAYHIPCSYESEQELYSDDAWLCSICTMEWALLCFEEKFKVPEECIRYYTNRLKLDRTDEYKVWKIEEQQHWIGHDEYSKAEIQIGPNFQVKVPDQQIRPPPVDDNMQVVWTPDLIPPEIIDQYAQELNDQQNNWRK